MAEQFGLHQRFGDCGTVDRDKRFFVARAFVVNGFCDEILAGAAFALNQNGGGLARRNLADEVHEFGHFRGDTDHAVIAGIAADFPAQVLDFGAQAIGFERVFDSDVKLVEIDGLADEIVCPEFERGLDIVELGIGGDHDHGAGVAVFLELIEDLNAGEVGHAHVEQDEVG